MPHILERATDPGITPGGVLLRHPYHELADLLEHAGTLRPLRVRPLPRDELPMPPQNRVGGDDRGDVAQCSASQSVPTYGQPTSFIIGQPQSPTHLSSEDSILFDQVGHPLLLPRFSQPARTTRNNRADVRSTTAGVYITDRFSKLKVVAQ
jgi:hypothetical protein